MRKVKAGILKTGCMLFLAAMLQGMVHSQFMDRAALQADSVLQKLNLEDCINLIAGCEGMQAPGIPRLGIPPA